MIYFIGSPKNVSISNEEYLQIKLTSEGSLSEAVVGAEGRLYTIEEWHRRKGMGSGCAEKEWKEWGQAAKVDKRCCFRNPLGHGTGRFGEFRFPISVGLVRERGQERIRDKKSARWRLAARFFRSHWRRRDSLRFCASRLIIRD